MTFPETTHRSETISPENTQEKLQQFKQNMEELSEIEQDIQAFTQEIHKGKWKDVISTPNLPSAVLEAFVRREVEHSAKDGTERFSESLQELAAKFFGANYSITPLQLRPESVQKFFPGKSASDVASILLNSKEDTFLAAVKLLESYRERAEKLITEHDGIPIRYLVFREPAKFETVYLPLENGKVNIQGKEYTQQQMEFLSAIAMYRYGKFLPLSSRDNPDYLYEKNGKKYIDTGKYAELSLNAMDQKILDVWEES